MKREKRAVRWKGWKRAFNSSFQAFSGVSCRSGRRRGGRENKNQRRERQAGVKTMQKKEVFLAIYSPYSKKSAFLEGVSGRIVRILWLFSTGPGPDQGFQAGNASQTPIHAVAQRGTGPAPGPVCCASGSSGRANPRAAVA